MDYNKLADLLFPNVTDTCEDVENRYPPRNLPEGAKVTRFAPSPTGFIHLGGIYGSMIDERLAHLSDGIFYLRIEDTDAKREVPGAAVELIKTLAEYGISLLRIKASVAVEENHLSCINKLIAEISCHNMAV